MNSADNRIDKKFKALRGQGRAAFISYIMAGDGDYQTSLDILLGLPRAGVDIIELGLPFSDPMADGVIIQKAGQRALAGGMTLIKTLEQVRVFRRADDITPIVLMGYYNPIYNHGVADFIRDAVAAGVDGVIIVDLPPEEDEELCLPAQAAGLHFIRLATPTTDAGRLGVVMRGAAGFVYYVAIKGVTGAGSSSADSVAGELVPIRAVSDLPICVGFGIKTFEDVRLMSRVADGVVVGSAIVERIADGDTAEQVLEFVGGLARGCAKKPN